MTNQDWITTVVMMAVFCVYMYCVVFGWLEQYGERNTYLGRKENINSAKDR